MRHPVTIDGVECIMRALGYEWRGPWQREAVQAMCDFPEVVIQGSRQVFGKTFCVGLFEAARIIAGNTVTIGYPTLTQGTRLLGERTIANVNRFGDTMEQLTGRKFWKKSREQTTYQRWALMEDLTHEGKLYSLSANEISIHVPEGYTTDDLDLDESHRLTQKTLGIFEPFTDIAAEQGNAHIVYLGVGGHKASLIETKKHQDGVKVVRWPASRIVAAEPRWAEVFDKRRASLSDWQWRQHYEVLQSTEGMRLMFPDPIPESISTQEWQRRGLTPVLFFGIDVGKEIDATVLKVIAVINSDSGKIINEIDTLTLPGCDYPDQGQILFDYVNSRYNWRAENIICETNGVGNPFRDILNKAGFRNIRGIFTTDDLKEGFWNQMNVMIREGRFGCKREESRLHYEGMMFEYVHKGDKYVMEFEHSDYWMALCMAFAGLSEIEAL
jgi:hypothetical protein